MWHLVSYAQASLGPSLGAPFVEGQSRQVNQWQDAMVAEPFDALAKLEKRTRDLEQDNDLLESKVETLHKRVRIFTDMKDNFGDALHLRFAKIE